MKLISTKVDFYNGPFVIRRWNSADYEDSTQFKEAILNYVDCLLKSFGKYALSYELNDLQVVIYEVDRSQDREKSCFADKTTIPIEIWNLILRPYNLKLEE